MPNLKQHGQKVNSYLITRLNPNVSIDCVVFGFDGNGLKILLIQRDNPESLFSRNHLLPGDLISDDEDLDTAARRVLKELTGLDKVYLEQFGAFGDPQRVKQENDLEWLRRVRKDPQARVITIGYFSLIKPEDIRPSSSSFARKAEWISLDAVPALAFDHDLILQRGLSALKNKMRDHPVGFELLPEKFSLGQLQNLFEAVLGIQIDKRNFRRKVLKWGVLKALDEHQQDVAHKPAVLYMFDKRAYESPNNNSLVFP